MTEPTYEYRVLNPVATVWQGDLQDPDHAERVRSYAERNFASEHGPYRIQRRLVTPWEDCDE